MDYPISIIAHSQISYNSMGGSDKIFIELARIWKKRGKSVTIFGCPEAAKMCERAELKDNFKKISGFDVDSLGIPFAYTLRTISAFLKYKMIKKGILYSSSDFYPDLIFAFWQKLLNPRIKWVAGIFLISPNPIANKSSQNIRGVVYWLSQRIAIVLMRFFADLIVVLCQEDKDFLVSKGARSDKTVIISGGVDKDIIDTVGEQEKKFAGCFVGRFHQQKGLPELISIWKNVCKVFPTAKLAIVGWGDSHWVNCLNELIRKNNLQDNILLMGFLDNQDKYKILKSSKLFLFPSSYESWGIVVAEAFACGLPVIAFDISATKKFQKGIILVKPGDLKYYSQEIIRFLMQEDLYRKYSEAAKEEAGRFSWESSVDNIEEALKKIYA